MRNLCRTHCVREALERDGWILADDGTLKQENARDDHVGNFRAPS
jgi:hypothetical protein